MVEFEEHSIEEPASSMTELTSSGVRDGQGLSSYYGRSLTEFRARESRVEYGFCDDSGVMNAGVNVYVSSIR
jgi:hypothetical protein